jgi:hypothetical protein
MSATVKVELALFVSEVSVIVALPGPFVVTSPVELTVATVRQKRDGEGAAHESLLRRRWVGPGDRRRKVHDVSSTR